MSYLAGYNELIPTQEEIWAPIGTDSSANQSQARIGAHIPMNKNQSTYSKPYMEMTE